MKTFTRLKRKYSKIFLKGRYLKYQRSPVILRALGKKKILLYTDSRGINIPGYLSYRHYSTRLLMKYDVEAYLCPEKWTTILDFLKLWESLNDHEYDAIILHAGIVDASPRHQSIALNRIYFDKRELFNDVFGEKDIIEHLHSDLGCDYEGEKTINMYSLEMAKKKLLPRLIRIPNLIWIGTNKIDTSWRGNYWKERPENIRLVEQYSELFNRTLPCAIDMLNAWSLDQVRLFTFDNIHPNSSGSNYIFKMLIRKLENI